MPPHPLELTEVNGCDVVDKHDVIHEAKGPMRFQSPKAVDTDEPPNAQQGISCDSYRAKGHAGHLR